MSVDWRHFLGKLLDFYQTVSCSCFNSFQAHWPCSTAFVLPIDFIETTLTDVALLRRKAKIVSVTLFGTLCSTGHIKSKKWKRGFESRKNRTQKSLKNAGNKHKISVLCAKFLQLATKSKQEPLQFFKTRIELWFAKIFFIQHSKHCCIHRNAILFFFFCLLWPLSSSFTRAT